MATQCEFCGARFFNFNGGKNALTEHYQKAHPNQSGLGPIIISEDEQSVNSGADNGEENESLITSDTSEHFVNDTYGDANSETNAVVGTVAVTIDISEDVLCPLPVDTIQEPPSTVNTIQEPPSTVNTIQEPPLTMNDTNGDVSGERFLNKTNNEPVVNDTTDEQIVETRSTNGERFLNKTNNEPVVNDMTDEQIVETNAVVGTDVVETSTIEISEDLLCPQEPLSTVVEPPSTDTNVDVDAIEISEPRSTIPSDSLLVTDKLNNNVIKELNMLMETITKSSDYITAKPAKSSKENVTCSKLSMSSYSEELLGYCINCEEYESLLQETMMQVEQRDAEIRHMKQIMEEAREESAKKEVIMTKLAVGVKEIQSTMRMKDKKLLTLALNVKQMQKLLTDKENQLAEAQEENLKEEEIEEMKKRCEDVDKHNKRNEGEIKVKEDEIERLNKKAD